MCSPLSLSSWHSEPSRKTLVVVMEGSAGGRGCLALRLHVVSKGRALPLAWRGRHRPQGHCPAALHIARVALLRRGPRGGPGGLARRWRVRWDGASGHAERERLGLRRPYRP